MSLCFAYSTSNIEKVADLTLVFLKNDLKTVSGLLGHSSIRMIEVYTRFVDELKKESVDSLPDIFGKS